MKLRRAHIREFKSIWDSNIFELGKATCLVGKNEAGKTALLQAMYRVNPIIAGDGEFDVTDDYPRAEVEDYQQDIEAKRRNAATVTELVFILDQDELDSIEDEFGVGALKQNEVIVSKGYAKNASGKSTIFYTIPLVEAAIVKNLVANFDLPDRVREKAQSTNTLRQLSQSLDQSADEASQAVTAAESAAAQIQDEAERASAQQHAKTLAESEQAIALRKRLAELLSKPNLQSYVWDKFLKGALPKFLYFDEYYQMRGHDNIGALKHRKETNTLQASDHPLLGLIELARLDLNQLLTPSRTQELKNKLQGASNHLSSRVLKYWSQNKHLRMNFDVRLALQGDPEGMRDGFNIWGEVFDSKHLVSTGLGTRSAGFVWFFSFLAWYSALKKKNENLVLLLDEPGLSLHGKAQEDLLRFLEAEVVANPNHQLVYTTHSPFMVDPQHFDRIRIVQDKGIDTDTPLPREEDGTKVITDVLEASPDSLFPLQGALGYEIHQSLFVGPNCLIVEGVSDLLYIQVMSGILNSLGRTGLDQRWTITPVGGAEKVPTFVALIGSQKNLKLATLIDFQVSSRQNIENLYKRRLLDRSHVLTFADFTGHPESDIEDMFDVDFYLLLVSGEYNNSLSVALNSGMLAGTSSRVLVRLESYLSSNPLTSGSTFNHYRPARYFSERGSSLTIPPQTLDRFEKAFRTANALL